MASSSKVMELQTDFAEVVRDCERNGKVKVTLEKVIVVAEKEYKRVNAAA